MGGPNWAKLFKQGRCKQIGIPWSEEELDAVYKLKIPAQYVRVGILTVEDYEVAKEAGIKKDGTMMQEARVIERERLLKEGEVLKAKIEKLDDEDDKKEAKTQEGKGFAVKNEKEVECEYKDIDTQALKRLYWEKLGHSPHHTWKRDRIIEKFKEKLNK